MSQIQFPNPDLSACEFQGRSGTVVRRPPPPRPPLLSGTDVTLEKSFQCMQGALLAAWSKLLVPRPLGPETHLCKAVETEKQGTGSLRPVPKSVHGVGPVMPSVEAWLTC